MNAGRELDALVAEKVMGLTPKPVTVIDGRGTRSDIGTTRDYTLPDGRPAREAKQIPAYSTDIAAAWTIVDTLRDSKDDVLRVRFSHEIGLVFAWAERYRAEHVAAAICRAALAAKGVEVPA